MGGFRKQLTNRNLHWKRFTPHVSMHKMDTVRTSCHQIH